MDNELRRTNFTDRNINLVDCKVYQSRLNFVLKTADVARAEYYRGNSNPSPLKIAACCAYALAREQPLVWHVATPVSPDEVKIVNRMTALRNAEMGLDIGLYLVSNSSYACKPEIKPPFELKYPSGHFFKEVVRNLACDELNAPALAYIYELLLLHSPKGRDLAHSLDRVSKATTSAKSQA